MQKYIHKYNTAKNSFGGGDSTVESLRNYLLTEATSKFNILRGKNKKISHATLIFGSNNNKRNFTKILNKMVEKNLKFELGEKQDKNKFIFGSDSESHFTLMNNEDNDDIRVNIDSNTLDRIENQFGSGKTYSIQVKIIKSDTQPLSKKQQINDIINAKIAAHMKDIDKKNRVKVLKYLSSVNF